MPCNSDHMAPTGKERAMQDSAIYQARVLKRLGRTVPAWLKREAKNIYAKDERNVTGLCAVLKEIGKEGREKLLYSDAHDAEMRDVAAWWEEHEKADKAREAREKKARRDQKAKQEALSKLSPSDKKALGLK